MKDPSGTLLEILRVLNGHAGRPVLRSDVPDLLDKLSKHIRQGGQTPNVQCAVNSLLQRELVSCPHCEENGGKL